MGKPKLEMKRFLTIAWFWLWLALGGALAAEQDLEHREPPFEYGTRPKDSVFDPGAAMSNAMHEQVAQSLKTLKERDSVDIVVVVLKDIGSAPPEHVAKQFAKAWCGEERNAVVLHVPGRDDSPWLVPGGSVIESYALSLLNSRVESAQRRARAELGDDGKIRAATEEVSDLIRFLGNSSDNRKQMIAEKFDESVKKYSRKEFYKKMALLAGLTALIPLMLAGFFIASRVRSSGARYFSEVSVRGRLGAPHAGGCHVVKNVPMRRKVKHGG